MEERDIKIAEAALAVFVRYGVGKTTMSDIAREANVARQTLYNAYESKEAVLRAAVRYAANQTFEAVDAEWRDQSELDHQLEAFFKHVPLNWYDMLQASPEAADLIDGIHTIANDELNEIAKLWTNRLKSMIRTYAMKGTETYENAEATADFIYSAASSAKQNAADRSVVERRLEILKLSILAMVRNSDQG